MRRDVEGAGDDSGTSSSGEEEDQRWQREAKLHAAEAARRAYSAAASGGWEIPLPSVQRALRRYSYAAPSTAARARSALGFWTLLMREAHASRDTMMMTQGA